MTVFFSDREVTARKPHRCEACLTAINPGDRYLAWRGANEGKAYTIPYHVECRSAEIEANKWCGTRYDEWSPLHDLVANYPEIVVDLAPAVAARFSMVAA